MIFRGQVFVAASLLEIFFAFPALSKRVVRRCARVGPLWKGLHAFLPDFVLVIERKLEDTRPPPSGNGRLFARTQVSCLLLPTKIGALNHRSVPSHFSESIVSCTRERIPNLHVASPGRCPLGPATSSEGLPCAPRPCEPRPPSRAWARRPLDDRRVGGHSCRTPASRWCTTRAHESRCRNRQCGGLHFAHPIILLPNVR